MRSEEEIRERLEEMEHLYEKYGGRGERGQVKALEWILEESDEGE